MNTSQFGEQPPARRPETIARDAFVRELCSQVGLSLDLARLAFAHRRELKAAAAKSERTEETAPTASAVLQLRLQDTAEEMASGTQEATTPVPLESSAETQQEADADGQASETHSQSCASNAGSTPTGSSQNCVRSTELKAVLARAGRYMAAMQMDMERLHDEHVARTRSLQAERRAAEPASQKAEPPPLEPGVQQADAEALAIADGIEQLEMALPSRSLTHDLEAEMEERETKESLGPLPFDFPSVSAEQVRASSSARLDT